MNKEKGFTIIELMVVITILAVLLGIGIISATNYITNQTLNSESNKIVSLLNDARKTSIVKGTEYNGIDNYTLYGLKFYSNKVEMFEYVSNIWPPSSVDNVTIISSENFKSFITNNLSDNYIIFNKKGFPNKFGTISLNLKNKTKEISISISGKSWIK